jgi:hypothetical protein
MGGKAEGMKRRMMRSKEFSKLKLVASVKEKKGTTRLEERK